MSVFRHFKLPQLLRKRKSDDNSIVNIPRFDCNALAVPELSRTMAYKTHNTVNRFAREELNPVVLEVSKEN